MVNLARAWDFSVDGRIYSGKEHGMRPIPKLSLGTSWEASPKQRWATIRCQKRSQWTILRRHDTSYNAECTNRIQFLVGSFVACAAFLPIAPENRAQACPFPFGVHHHTWIIRLLFLDCCVKIAKYCAQHVSDRGPVLAGGTTRSTQHPILPVMMDRNNCRVDQRPDQVESSPRTYSHICSGTIFNNAFAALANARHE